MATQKEKENNIPAELEKGKTREKWLGWEVVDDAYIPFISRQDAATV